MREAWVDGGRTDGFARPAEGGIVMRRWTAATRGSRTGRRNCVSCIVMALVWGGIGDGKGALDLRFGSTSLPL